MGRGAKYKWNGESDARGEEGKLQRKMWLTFPVGLLGRMEEIWICSKDWEEEASRGGLNSLERKKYITALLDFSDANTKGSKYINIRMTDFREIWRGGNKA